MTNYNAWDSKAEQLCREADADDKEQEAASNQALGLSGRPEGPPVAQAEEQLQELGKHSKQRADFIDWSKGREVQLSHTEATGGGRKGSGPIELSGPDLHGKAVRLSGSAGVTYLVPPDSGLAKLMVDNCSNVSIRIQFPMLTSTVEVYKCSELDLDLEVPLGTLQVDECLAPVRVRFAERDYIGATYHQHSPGLMLSWNGSDGTEPRQVGIDKPAQFCTRFLGDSLTTTAVQRGEGEYPIDLNCSPLASEQPEPEAIPTAEEQKRLAEVQRMKGNDMFRASDFAQAAALYTLALQLDPSQGAVWSNRSQCWMKMGDMDKALADAIRCTEVDPSNAKGWFRKGMSLHAMARYPEAIPSLLEAEKLEPSNKQIQDAIKMAQLKARQGQR